MISERSLASGYSTFWRELLPLADHAIKHINLALTQRYLPEMRASVASGALRGVINELSFRLVFAKAIGADDAAAVAELELKVCEYVGRLSGVPKEVLLSAMTAEHRREAKELSERLDDWLPPVSAIKFAPLFTGCGFVDSCEGDLLLGKTLVEVKAPDRAFRMVDVRQLLTYAALDRASRQYNIQGVAMLNPRRGLVASLSLDDLAQLLSGMPSTMLLDDMVRFFSADELQV